MDILLDDTGDIDVANNILTLTTGADGIAQHLSQRLRTFYAEWFLDKRVGIPYFEHVLVKNPDPIVLDALFKNEIMKTQGVLELVAFNMEMDKALREFKLSFKVRTHDGTVTFSEVIP